MTRPNYRSSGKRRPGIRGKNGAKQGRYVFVVFNPESAFPRTDYSQTDFDEAVAFAQQTIRTDKFSKTAEVRARIGGEEKRVFIDRRGVQPGGG